MSSITARSGEIPVAPKNYVTAKSTLASWLFTTDHKRIAVLYMISITIFFGMGGLFAMLIRLCALGAQHLPFSFRLTARMTANRVHAIQ